MGYAQLVFPSTPQAGQVIKAIAKVLTGETNLANIEGLASGPVLGSIVYSSEIYNPSAHAWTLQYPASLPGTGNFVIPTVTLKSECLTSGKFKFIRLAIGTSAGVYTEPAGGVATNYSLTTNYTIYGQGLSAIDGSGNATNPTYRNSDGSSAFIKKATSTSEVYVVRLSWSNRHVFCSAYLSVSGNSTFFGCFEHDENHLSTYSSAAPCLHVTGFGATSTLSNYAVNDAGDWNVVSMLATYNPATSTTPGVRALTTQASLHMSNIAEMGLASATSSEYLTRQYKYNNALELPTAPLYINDTVSQLGIINSSKYSNMYLYYNSTQELSTITNADGTASYKLWRLYNAALSSFSTILVPYF
jgi:hypothetical protein